jgi:hypothetical protein
MDGRGAPPADGLELVVASARARPLVGWDHQRIRWGTRPRSFANRSIDCPLLRHAITTPYVGDNKSASATPMHSLVSMRSPLAFTSHLLLAVILIGAALSNGCYFGRSASAKRVAYVANGTLAVASGACSSARPGTVPRAPISGAGMGQSSAAAGGALPLEIAAIGFLALAYPGPGPA